MGRWRVLETLAGRRGGGRGGAPAPLALGLVVLGLALAAGMGGDAGPPAGPSTCEVVTAPGLVLPRDVLRAVREVFAARARGLLTGDGSAVDAFYDREPGAGRWALEHDRTRIAHLAAWAAARGVVLEAAAVHVRVGLAELERDRAWLEMGVTERITYRHAGGPEAPHSFGVGAWHVLQLVRREGRWLVQRDWYSDPLHEAPVVADGAASPPGERGAQGADGRPGSTSGGPGEHAGSSAGGTRAAPGAVAAPGGSPPEGGAGRGGGRYRREAAVRYADRYCGPAAGPDSHYNREYRDYSHLGGDCANFVSQALSDPEAGGLPTDYTWRYAGGKGTRAWVRAEDLVSYLLDSGRASLLGHGRFGEVAAPPGGAVYRLLPGDVVGYEQGGGIRHVALLVGHDPAGYPLVNSHTGDRHRVPWDLGWDASTVFWLLHITE